MTAIKQVAVTSAAHVKNLGSYLNDERALDRDSQNLVNEKNWEREFDRTREAYGHNSPSRAGTTNTYMYHQILGFNPDEIDLNGGKLTPQDCMNYAREYVNTRYPNQEAVWVLHKEHCRADGTDRYAVHIGINRTDLETGNRLNEGRSKNAKIERANAIRDMDKKWGLRQVKANERNSKVHARQPTRAEKEMEQRGIKSEKAFIKERIGHHIQEIQKSPQENNVRELAKKLESDGIKMTQSKDKQQFQFRRNGIAVNGVKLGKGFSKAAISHAVGATVALTREAMCEDGLER